LTSAAAPATTAAEADVPAKPRCPQPPSGSENGDVAASTLSGATRSGSTRPSIAGPREL
jgi:hypothetical protein